MGANMLKSNKKTDSKVEKSTRQAALRRTEGGIIYPERLQMRHPRYYMEGGNADASALQRKQTASTMPLKKRLVLGRQNQVIQLQSNVNVDSSCTLPDTGGVALPVSPEHNLPVMVFESMGKDIRACDKIYNQTLSYEGNTICVFGLNGNTAENVTMASLQNLIKEEYEGTKGQAKKSTTGPFQHLLYVFPFTWKEPNGLSDDEYYRMPYIEARLAIIRKATDIADLCRKECGEDSSIRFLFRWIDGDAGNDTTKNLSAEQLNSWADDTNPLLISGGYDWRHEDENTATTMPTYHSFIEELNKAEKILRHAYHNVAQKWYYNPLSNNGYLPGYYLPETTLLMNEEAHNVLAGVGYNKEGSQDKESMIIADKINALPNDKIRHQSNIRVDKPLKQEFKSGSYLGEAMLKFFRGDKFKTAQENSIEHDFITALKDIRQSAFGKRWYFLSTSTWSNWENQLNIKQPYIGKVIEEKDQYRKISPKEKEEKIQTWYNWMKANQAKNLWGFLCKNGPNHRLKTIHDEFTKNNVQ